MVLFKNLEHWSSVTKDLVTNLHFTVPITFDVPDELLQKHLYFRLNGIQGINTTRFCYILFILAFVLRRVLFRCAKTIVSCFNLSITLAISTQPVLYFVLYFVYPSLIPLFFFFFVTTK